MTQVHRVQETPGLIASWTIEQEKIVNALKCEKRFEEFTQILHGTMEDDVSAKYVLYVFGTIAITYSIMGLMTLFPVHNVIENPEYWWESMLHIPNVLIPMFSGYLVLNCSFWMNTDYIKALKHFFILWLVGMVVFIIAYTTSYLLWTEGLDYNWPQPFSGSLCAYIALITQDITLWYLFPHDRRKNSTFKDKFKYKME